MKTFLKILLFSLVIAVTLTAAVSCGNNKTEYTLETRGSMPDITKGYFGEQNSSVFPFVNDYISTNADDLTYSAVSSDPSVAKVEMNKEKMTLTVLKGEGESEITVTVSSVKANKSVDLKFKVSAVTYSKVACIGDSLTYGHSWPEEAYPIKLAEALGSSFNVQGFGKNGASVTGFNPPLNLKYSTLDEYQASLDFDADIVIIMLGTNDSKGWSDAEPIFKAEYEKLIEAYREVNPEVKIILVTAPPTMENNKFSIPGNVITNDVVPLQKELADENDLTLVDFSGRFLDRADHSDPYAEFIRGDAAFDGVHLTIEGAEFLAELIVEAIYGM